MRRAICGKAVRAGRDRREGNRSRPAFLRPCEGAEVDHREQRFFAVGAAVPDRADGVNDELRGKQEARRYDGVAWFAPAERPRRAEQRRARGAVNGTVDAAPPLSAELAALTIASTRTEVMSPFISSIIVAPSSQTLALVKYSPTYVRALANR